MKWHAQNSVMIRFSGITAATLVLLFSLVALPAIAANHESGGEIEQDTSSPASPAGAAEGEYKGTIENLYHAAMPRTQPQRVGAAPI